MSKIHTTGTDKTTFFHTGDFSGHVDIVECGPNGERVNMVNIPFADLEYIVTEKKRKEMVTAIEDLDLSLEQDRKIVERLYQDVFKGL